MHWKQRCLDKNVKQWVVFDEMSKKKKKEIILLDYSQNNSKEIRILTIYIYIYTRNVSNILGIIITVVLAATCESENKYDTFIYVEWFRNTRVSRSKK